MFDIDDTLLNAKRFNEDICAQYCALMKISHDEFFKIRVEEYTSHLATMNDMDPTELCKVLQKHAPKISLGTLVSIYFSAPDVYYRSLFDDVISCIENLSKTNQLGIFTEGVEKYQWMKLESFGILKYLEPDFLFVLRNKLTKETFESLPEGAIIIDDKPINIQALLACGRSDLHPILLDRQSLHQDLKLESIKSLTEIKYLKYF